MGFQAKLYYGGSRGRATVVRQKFLSGQTTARFTQLPETTRGVTASDCSEPYRNSADSRGGLRNSAESRGGLRNSADGSRSPIGTPRVRYRNLAVGRGNFAVRSRGIPRPRCGFLGSRATRHVGSHLRWQCLCSPRRTHHVVAPPRAGSLFIASDVCLFIGCDTSPSLLHPEVPSPPR